MWGGMRVILKRYSEGATRLKAMQWHATYLARMQSSISSDIKSISDSFDDALKNGRSKHPDNVFVKYALQHADVLRSEHETLELCGHISREVATSARTMKRELKDIVTIHFNQKEKLDAELISAQTNLSRSRAYLQNLSQKQKRLETRLRDAADDSTGLGRFGGRHRIERRVFAIRDNVETARRRLGECEYELGDVKANHDNCNSQQLDRMEQQHIDHIASCKALLKRFLTIGDALMEHTMRSPWLLSLSVKLTRQSEQVYLEVDDAAMIDREGLAESFDLFRFFRTDSDSMKRISFDSRMDSLLRAQETCEKVIAMVTSKIVVDKSHAIGWESVVCKYPAMFNNHQVRKLKLQQMNEKRQKAKRESVFITSVKAFGQGVADIVDDLAKSTDLVARQLWGPDGLLWSEGYLMRRTQVVMRPCTILSLHQSSLPAWRTLHYLLQYLRFIDAGIFNRRLTLLANLLCTPIRSKH